MESPVRKPKVTKGAVFIPAPFVLFQAGATSFLGLASGKMPTEQGRWIGHALELSLDQLERHLGQGVRLGQHGCRGLGKDLVRDHGRHFLGNVHVGNS